MLAIPGSFAAVLGAVALEVAGGMNANSSLPSWARLAPLAWPPWARVLWWLGVALAAATFRAGLHKVGMGSRRLADLLTVGPFVAFAVGIALGADWATWH